MNAGLLRLPRFRGATHADDHDNRSRHRQVGQHRGTGCASQISNRLVPDQNSRLGNGPNWRSLSRPAPSPLCTGSCVGGRSARSPPRSMTNAKPFSLRSCSRSISANATAKCPTGPRSRPDAGLGRAQRQDFILGMLDECGAVAAASHRSVVPATKNLCLSHAVRPPLQHQPRLSESW